MYGALLEHFIHFFVKRNSKSTRKYVGALLEHFIIFFGGGNVLKFSWSMKKTKQKYGNRTIFIEKPKTLNRISFFEFKD